MRFVPVLEYSQLHRCESAKSMHSLFLTGSPLFLHFFENHVANCIDDTDKGIYSQIKRMQLRFSSKILITFDLLPYEAHYENLRINF